MNRNFLQILFGAFLAAAMFSASATPVNVTFDPKDGSNEGESVVYQFNAAAAGTGVLNFTLMGFVSLDGDNAFSDIFSFDVNGKNVFSGTFDLGGGGANVIYFQDPSVNVVSTETFGAYQGGQVVFSVAHALLAGTNSYTFQYTPLESREDEGWAIEGARVTGDVGGPVTAVPEPGTLALLGLGLLGFSVARRRKN